MYKSPGVSVRELDLSSYILALNSSIRLGIIGGARSGPVGEVVHISSPREFRRVFGDPIDFSGLAALEYLGNASTLQYIRATDEGTIEYREGSLNGKTSDDVAVNKALTIRGRYPGTIMDDEIKVTVSSIELDMFELEVTYGDSVNMSIVVSTDPTKINYVGDYNHPELLFTLEEDTATVDEGTITLTAGNDGKPEVLDDYSDALDIFGDEESSDLDLLAIPGTTLGPIVSRLVEIADTRKDLLVILDPPQGITTSEAVDYFNGVLVSDEIAKVDSSYVASYFPWVQIYNQVKATNEWMPPSVAVLSAMGKLYGSNPAWTAPAGIPKMALSNVSALELSLVQADRDKLYVGNINPLCNYKGLGITALGQKTMQRNQSSVDRINVRMLANYVKKIIQHNTVGYLFSEIDDITMSSWVQTIDAELATIKQERGVYDYKVKMDWETVTQDHLNNNIMPGIVQIKPTKVAEYIPIDLVLKNKDEIF